MIIMKLMIPLFCLVMLAIFSTIPFSFAVLSVYDLFVQTWRTSPALAVSVAVLETAVLLLLLFGVAYYFAERWRVFLGIP
jgi:hypothetical protein